MTKSRSSTGPASLRCGGMDGMYRRWQPCSHHLMTPQIAPISTHDMPGRLVNLPPSPAVLDFKTSWRNEVERQHFISCVPPQRHRYRILALLNDVVGCANVVELVHLQHQVVEPRAISSLQDSEAVMPRVAVVEVAGGVEHSVDNVG